MGLDMYLYRAKKANVSKEEIHPTEWFCDNGYQTIDKKVADKENALSDLIPISSVTRETKHVYDMDKIKKAFDIENEYELQPVMISQEKIIFSAILEKNAHIKYDEFNDKYKPESKSEYTVENENDFESLLENSKGYGDAVDIEKIKNDYPSLYNNAYPNGFDSEGIIMESYISKEIEISTDDIEHKYIKDVDIDVYAFEITEEKYWRKEYGIEKIFYKEIGKRKKVENCGYYKVSEDFVNKKIPDMHPIHLEKGEELFYHEWY